MIAVDDRDFTKRQPIEKCAAALMSADESHHSQCAKQKVAREDCRLVSNTHFNKGWSFGSCLEYQIASLCLMLASDT